MRPLWPIERQVLELTAANYPASYSTLRRQIDTAQVVSFENSGAGFFSYLAVDDDTPLLTESSPLGGPDGDVTGVEHGMGFLVFLEEGRLSCIEGFSYGDTSTRDIDFSCCAYEFWP